MPKQIGDMTLYTVLELSKLLDVTEVTLRRYIKDGKLKATLMGGKYLISEDTLKEWEPFLTAEISHGGSPAPFNPEGLPIKTSNTEKLTRLLQDHAKNRIAELKSDPHQVIY